MKFFEAMSKLIGEEITDENKDTVIKQALQSGKIINTTTVFRNLQFNHPQGIYFECVNCGQCCHQQIPIAMYEKTNFETVQNTDKEIFATKLLKGTAANTPCPYMKDNKCSIYDNRPFTCRTYPWTLDTSDIEHPLSSWKWIIQLKFQCNGFHLGKVKIKQLKPMVSAIKQFKNEFTKELEAMQNEKV